MEWNGIDSVTNRNVMESIRSRIGMEWNGIDSVTNRNDMRRLKMPARDKIEKYNRYMNKCINNFLFIYIVECLGIRLRHRISSQIFPILCRLI